MDTIEVIKDEDVEPALLKNIPHSFVKSTQIFPIRRHDSELIGAVADEKGILALAEASRMLGLKPKALKAPAGVILDAINRFYGQMGSAEEVMATISGEDLSAGLHVRYLAALKLYPGSVHNSTAEFWLYKQSRPDSGGLVKSQLITDKPGGGVSRS